MPTGVHATPTFGEIALRCRRGEYDSVDGLQADAAAAAAEVLAAADEAAQQEQRRIRGRDPPSHDDWLEAQAAVGAACAAQDKVDAACFGLRQELHLSDPATEALLAAAAAHIRRLQEEEVERRQRAAAAEEAARRQAEQAAARREQNQQQQELEVDGSEGQAEGEQEETQEMEGAGDQRGAAEGEAAAAAPAAGTEQQQREAEQQQQQQPMDVSLPAIRVEQEDAAAAAAAEERRLRQQRVASAAQLLRQRVHDLLLPALHQRMPAGPPPDSSAWQALQEWAGRLSAAAAAACRQALEGSGVATTAGDGTADRLAARCAEAFAAAEAAA